MLLDPTKIRWGDEKIDNEEAFRNSARDPSKIIVGKPRLFWCPNTNRYGQVAAAPTGRFLKSYRLQKGKVGVTFLSTLPKYYVRRTSFDQYPMIRFYMAFSIVLAESVGAYEMCELTSRRINS